MLTYTMKVLRINVALIPFICFWSFASADNSVSQSTRGQCSPTISGVVGNVNLRFDCSERQPHTNQHPNPESPMTIYKIPSGYSVSIAQTIKVADLYTIINTLGASRQTDPIDPNAPRINITTVSTYSSAIVGDCTPFYAEISYQLLFHGHMNQIPRTARSKQICLNRQPDRNTADNLVTGDATNVLLQQLP